MKVLCCGDRNWSDPNIILERLKKLPKDTLIIQGGARGADTMAAGSAASLGLKVEEHKAEWNIYGKAAGPIRNEEMIRRKPDLVIAFHNDIGFSKGTKDMVERAINNGIKYEVIGVCNV